MIGPTYGQTYAPLGLAGLSTGLAEGLKNGLGMGIQAQEVGARLGETHEMNQGRMDYLKAMAGTRAEHESDLSQHWQDQIAAANGRAADAQKTVQAWHDSIAKQNKARLDQKTAEDAARNPAQALALAQAAAGGAAAPGVGSTAPVAPAAAQPRYNWKQLAVGAPAGATAQDQ